MHSELDAYDRRILALLQEDASLSSAQIAEQVGLSQSPCWRRIQRLKEEGVIRAQVTLLDRKKIGLVGCGFDNSLKSAPEKPEVFLARKPKSISLAIGRSFIIT